MDVTSNCTSAVLLQSDFHTFCWWVHLERLCWMQRVDLQATPSCSGLAAAPVCSCVDSGSLRDPADSTHCRCDTVVCTDTGFYFCSFESPPLPMLDKRCYLKMYICYYLEISRKHMIWCVQKAKIALFAEMWLLAAFSNSVFICFKQPLCHISKYLLNDFRTLQCPSFQANFHLLCLFELTAD